MVYWHILWPIEGRTIPCSFREWKSEHLHQKMNLYTILKTIILVAQIWHTCVYSYKRIPICIWWIFCERRRAPNTKCIKTSSLSDRLVCLATRDRRFILLPNNDYTYLLKYSLLLWCQCRVHNETSYADQRRYVQTKGSMENTLTRKQFPAWYRHSCCLKIIRC